MSNTEPVPLETLCRSGSGEQVQLLPPRAVPLGGPRGMNVRRTLPQRRRSLVGAWCFLDSYGPDDVTVTDGMNVARHPHTGLATVSWLFTGSIDHLDSAGNRARVRPGEMSLMLAGRGITHQEYSTPETTVLHGAQLWYALPDATREQEHDFAYYAPEPVRGPGWSLRVFLGSLAGSTSPVDPRTTPLLGAEVHLEPGAAWDVELDQSFEHAVLVDSGGVLADGVDLPGDHLAYFPPGRQTLTLATTHDGGPTRLLLLGGEPFGEDIVLWWNFVGRSHEEIAAYRAIYQHEIGDGARDGAGDDDERTSPAEPLPGVDPAVLAAAGFSSSDAPRFGPYPDDQPAALPAPPLPNARLRPRG